METKKIKIVLTKVGTAYEPTKEYHLHDYIVTDNVTLYTCKRVDKETMVCVGHPLTDTDYWDKSVDLSDALAKATKATNDAITATQEAAKATIKANTAANAADTATQKATDATNNAVTATTNANSATTKANDAATGAEKVDATLEDDTLSVTDRTGAKKQLELITNTKATEIEKKVSDLSNKKFDSENITQELGNADNKVISQKASKKYLREFSNAASSNCFILVDDYFIASGTNLPVFYNKDDTSYRCLYANLLPNKKYIFEYLLGLVSVNFYTGTIDNAILVESKVYNNGITTPTNYDFCLISVKKNYKEYTKYNFYEKKTITSEELADNIIIKTVPLSLTDEAITDVWESGVLNEKGEVIQHTDYKVSPFIDYSGRYKEDLLLQFKASKPYTYNNICIYSKESHTFIGGFPVIGNNNEGILTSIQVHEGISVRLCTINKLANWYKLGNGNVKDAFIRDKQQAVTSKNLADSSVTTNKLADGSVTTNKLADANTVKNSTTIVLSAENTTLKNGLYFDIGYKENTSDSAYQSILYNNISSYNLIDISNYIVGGIGGAFLDSNETVLQVFSSSRGENHVLRIPSNATIIAITVRANDKYKDIYGIIESKKYHLENLLLKVSQLEYDKPLQITNNHWYGKKLCIIGTSVAHGSGAETAYGYVAQQKLGFTMIPAGVPGQAIHGKIVSYTENGEQKTILSPIAAGSGSLTKAEYAAAKAVKDNNLSSEVVGMAIPESPNNPSNWAGEDKRYNDYYRTWENLFCAENRDVDLWIYATVPNNTNFALDDWNEFDTAKWKYKDDSSFASHRTTFLGAMLYMMDKMYKNQPKARMVLVLDSDFSYKDSTGKGNMELLSKTFNIPLIDLWSKTNTCPKSKLQTWSNNGTNTHPSTFAHEIMGDIFTNELLLVR